MNKLLDIESYLARLMEIHCAPNLSDLADKLEFGVEDLRSLYHPWGEEEIKTFHQLEEETGVSAKGYWYVDDSKDYSIGEILRIFFSTGGIEHVWDAEIACVVRYLDKTVYLFCDSPLGIHTVNYGFVFAQKAAMITVEDKEAFLCFNDGKVNIQESIYRVDRKQISG